MDRILGLAALQIGLTEILRSFGVEVAGICGHSAGEIGASYASGASDLKTTMAIAR
jgi:fatty acid synthase